MLVHTSVCVCVCVRERERERESERERARERVCVCACMFVLVCMPACVGACVCVLEVMRKNKLAQTDSQSVAWLRLYSLTLTLETWSNCMDRVGHGLFSAVKQLTWMVWGMDCSTQSKNLHGWCGAWLVLRSQKTYMDGVGHGNFFAV